MVAYGALRGLPVSRRVPAVGSGTAGGATVAGFVAARSRTVPMALAQR
jgi:hypothetical protein